ncbi:MAG: DUF2911 domain-containing protein, partial [Ignavibacteriota bacterium]
ESQKASVSQTIGLTNIEIVYHRPAVKGRKIWGELVPYDNGVPMPWRAGANENTTISFSTDVTIEGKPLSAGLYGLHMIPSEKEWTIIFSKNNSSWGSFSYDKDEDALRVSVKPSAADFREFLAYEFPDPQADKVVAELRWEKLKVGFTIGVDLHQVILASMRRELRNTPGFSWIGFNDAANYCADENINFDEAIKWANRSVSSNENFYNLETLSQLQMKSGKAEDSKKTMERAMSIAKPIELNNHGRQLLSQNKTEEAMKYFEFNLKKNPDIWFVYAGMARGYEAKKDMKAATENMKIALQKAPDNAKPGIESILKRWQTN